MLKLGVLVYDETREIENGELICKNYTSLDL
jgi:hypothetical protein